MNDLLALEALGALDGEEKQTIEAHLATCEACRRERDALAQAAASLAYATPAVSPPAGLKSRLLARVGRRPRVARAWVGWAAACALLTLGLAVSLSALSSTRRQLVATQSKNAELAASVAQLRDRLAVIETPDLKLASLAGLAPAPKAEARLFWSPAQKAWLVTFFDLPSLKEGQTYQLWAITPKEKLSMGTLGAKAAGTVVFKATPPVTDEPLQAVAVSIEPEGGVPQPTGPIALLGTL